VQIDQERFRQILASRSPGGKKKPGISKILYRVPPLLWGRAAAQSTVEFLAGIPALEDLTPKELSQLSQVMHERSFGDGEIIYDQGTPSAALYVIRNGSVEMFRKADGAEVVLATLAPNELFGEISLLIDEGARFAGARSRGPSDLLALSRPDFETLMVRSPIASVKFLRGIGRIVAEKFRLLMETMEAGAPE